MRARYQIDHLRQRGVELPPLALSSHVDTIHHSSLGEMPLPEVLDEYNGGQQFPGCGAERVQLAGGMFAQLLTHPMLEPFEQLYRRLPDEGMFDPALNPQRPVAFELGAFRAPPGMALLLFDLRPDIYRFNGAAAGDTLPVEARRYSTIMGFELTLDQRHPGNTSFQLDPVAIQTGALQAFTGPTIPAQFGAESPFVADYSQSRFNITAASSFAAAAGAGTALMPQRTQRYGALSVPFCLWVKEGQTVQVRGVVFRPIPHPIAFFEYDIAGVVAPHGWIAEMMECLKPTTFASRGPGSLSGGPR